MDPVRRSRADAWLPLSAYRLGLALPDHPIIPGLAPPPTLTKESHPYLTAIHPYRWSSGFPKKAICPPGQHTNKPSFVDNVHAS